jgi:HAD domain in Swiss Army Knife RNA repair proteins
MSEVTRVLFLDVDGVLNRLDPDTEELLTVAAPGMRTPHVVELNVVRALNAAIAGCPDTRIVVSSTWREDFASPEDFCVQAAVDPALLHADWRTKFSPEPDSPRSRPDEIEEWLSRHPEVRDWVILDDTPFDFPRDRFIPVPPERALTFRLLREALWTLGYTLDETYAARPRRRTAGRA